MDYHLDGKRVAIIGGSSGIGLETARLALGESAFEALVHIGYPGGFPPLRRQPTNAPYEGTDVP